MTTEQKERIGKLVKALRSGEYQQVTGQLRAGSPKGVGYCCLGVACELYRKETGDGQWDENNQFIPGDNNGEYQIMPDAVWQWFGFGNCNPAPGYYSATLASLNDAGDDFNKIAEYIEGHWLKGEEVV